MFLDVPKNIGINPIFLIDASGSTEAKYKHHSIFKEEIEITKKICNEYNVNQIYLMFWSSSNYNLSESLIDISDIDDMISDIHNNKKLWSSTNITNALSNINETWLLNNNSIIIITDGQIDSNQNLKSEILNKKNNPIYIFTIENNGHNYNNNILNSGTHLYKIIKKLNLTNIIKLFKCYNQYHDDGFINFQNNTIPIDHIPFKDKMFHKSDFPKFMNYINDINNTNTFQEWDELLYNISVTFCYLTQNVCHNVEKTLLKYFIDVLNNCPYQDIKNRIQFESNQRKLGFASTFQEYKQNRLDIFSMSQNELYTNVRDSITFNSEFTSFISTVNNKNSVLSIVDPILNNYYSGIHKYKMATCNSVPILPLYIHNNTDSMNQCLRQWIRVVYSNNHNITPTSEKIIYMFLFDVLRIYLSDIDTNIKDAYIAIGKNMLYGEKYGTNNTELEYLNTLVTENKLDDKIKILNFTDIDATLLWNSIFNILNLKHLQTQDVDLDTLNGKIDLIEQIKINQEIEYYCYITNESTYDTGGFKLKSHLFYNKTHCNPKFVISQEGFDLLSNNIDKFNCPICIQPQTLDNLIKIPPHNSSDSSNNFNNFNTTKRNIVEIPPTFLSDYFDDKLFSIDELDFNVPPYSINSPTIIDSLNNTRIIIKNTHDLNKKINDKYSFLTDLNMDNVCLAGGFCRSILLNQQVKDFDFFFFNLENPINRFKTLAFDLTSKIKTMYPNVKFLSIFKPQFNVYEILCINDKNDSINEEFNLNNYDKYNYNSLFPYSKDTINPYKKQKKVNSRGEDFDKNDNVDKIDDKIDENDTDKIDDKNDTDKNDNSDVPSNDFNNYFEDNDKKGISLMFRLQFILINYNSTLDLLNTFDLSASKVVYDGKTVYFTESSYFSFKYMVNILNNHKYNDLYIQRISKYFNYGFNIVLPELIDNNNNILQIENTNYIIINRDDKHLIIKHDSNNFKQIKRNIALENRANQNRIVLYTFSNYYSLVSLLRYIKINNISYIFGSSVFLPDDNGVQKFLEKEETISFINEIKTKYYKNIYDEILQK